MDNQPPLLDMKGQTEQSEPQKPTLSSTILGLWENKNSLFRGWLILATIYFFSLLFGVAIFIIVLGILFALRSTIYWKPTRTLLIKWFNMKLYESPRQNKSRLTNIIVSIFHVILALIYIALGSYIIKFGIDILLRDGFLGQNFIYLLFFR